ncbi:hypothetical protein GCM10018783_00340 [Streptomyces griseosporeus]|nr:hypothetical protein GCM10018783_00340 [Streptomyces griseosporeus]
MRSNSGTRLLRRLAHRRTDRQKHNRRGPGRRGNGGTSRAERLGLVAAALPGLTALVALVFTWMSVEGTRAELRIAEQGQITNRFNAAIRNLGSDSADVRLGGIHGLERIMQDSPRDQPTIVSVLSAYVRRHAPVPASGFVKEPNRYLDQFFPVTLPTDVQATLNVLGRRSPDHDGQAVLDLRETDLRGAEVFGQLEAPDKPKSRAAFRWADFNGADLRHSLFIGVDLREAAVFGANLTGADFRAVDLSKASMETSDWTSANLENANLTRADLNYAKLHEVQLDQTVNLTKATLVDADLTGAVLAGADLRGADLTGADLRHADLTGAKLAGVNWSGAKLDGVQGLPPSLRT